MKSLPWNDRASLPKEPGIYYVYRGRNPFTRELLYVGIGKNLRERHTNNFGYGRHHRENQLNALGATHIEYRIIENERQLKHEEAIAIAKHRPPLNIRKEKPDRWLLWQDQLSSEMQRWLCIAIGVTVTWRYLLPMVLNWLVNG